MSKYRKKTGWVPQEEREFVLSDTRPDRIDRDRLADLILVMAFSRTCQSRPQTGPRQGQTPVVSKLQ